MRTVGIVVRIPAGDLAAAFGLLADFAAFQALAADVRSVDVHPGPGTARDSDWEVSFRRGVLRWNEWESVDQERMVIEFGQTDGDFAEFHGHWRLTPAGEVRFELTFDFGIDSLAGLMDPIAERLVTRVVCSVLSGLFGEITLLEGGEALSDLVRQG